MQRPTLGSRLVARLTPGPGCIVAVIVTLIVLLTFVGMVVGAWLAGGVGFMLGFFLVPIVMTVVWVLWFSWLHEEPLRPRMKLEPLRVRVLPPPAVDEKAVRQRFHGRIRDAGDLLRSPLTGAPCVAYRLCGRVGSVEIDEADATTFSLEVGSELIEVDPRPATVNLRVGEPQRIVEVSPALAELLSSRGASPEADEVVLGEAHVCAGDEVSVEATVLTAARPAGYRGSTRTKVLHEQTGSPLVIEVAG